MLTLKSSRYTKEDAKMLLDFCEYFLYNYPCKDATPNACQNCEKRHACQDLILLANHSKHLYKRLCCLEEIFNESERTAKNKQ